MQVRRYFLSEGGREAVCGSCWQLGREWWKALRVWEIHVKFLYPNYLLLALRETWLLSGFMRKITWLVLRIAKPIYMVVLFYLREINLSHTLI